MEVINEVSLSLLSKSSNESYARVAVAGFFAQLDPTLDEITDIKTAISEAVTNCIVHAYRDRVGKIYITAKITADGYAYVKIRDRGCGIENVKQAMEPMFTTAPEEERAGLGFAVMQMFMDKIKVFSTLGKGTTVVMMKKINSRQKNG